MLAVSLTATPVMGAAVLAPLFVVGCRPAWPWKRRAGAGVKSSRGVMKVRARRAASFPPALPAGAPAEEQALAGRGDYSAHPCAARSPKAAHELAPGADFALKEGAPRASRPPGGGDAWGPALPGGGHA
eukprot:scaffold1702_cov391-Prasinococcus_capsulatus_cf.AAC.9